MKHTLLGKPLSEEEKKDRDIKEKELDEAWDIAVTICMHTIEDYRYGHITYLYCLDVLRDCLKGLSPHSFHTREKQLGYYIFELDDITPVTRNRKSRKALAWLPPVTVDLLKKANRDGYKIAATKKDEKSAFEMVSELYYKRGLKIPASTIKSQYINSKKKTSRKKNKSS